MEQNVVKEDEVEIDLREIMHVLLAKIWLIAFFGIIAGLVVFIYSKYIVDPVYTSTTKVYVLNRQNMDGNVTYTDLQTGSQITKDFMELVKNRTVLTQVITELELDMDEEKLAQMITVSTPTDTRVVEISVESTDVYEAQNIANKVREVAAVYIRDTMNLEAVNTVEEANIPTKPSSPDVRRNTILGVLAGIFIAAAVVIIIYMMDDSIRTPDDVERYLNVGVLASIPVLETNSKKKHRHQVPEFDREAHIRDEESEEDDTMAERLRDEVRMYIDKNEEGQA